MNDNDEFLTDDDVPVEDHSSWQRRPLRDRPLMPNVHHIAGDHRGEPGPGHEGGQDDIRN